MNHNLKVGILFRNISYQQSRGLLRPPKNLPYRGVYREEGEVVKKGDLLVNQFKLNYHPGLNGCLKVLYENDRGERLLRANCDGVVKITHEKCNPDYDLPEMKEYEHRKDVELYKFTFNVIPFEMSQTHILRHEI